MSQETLTSIIEVVLSIVATVATGVVIPALVSWIKSKTDSAKLKTAIDDISQAAEVAVNYVEQTIVSQMKNDGEWNSENQKKALQTAIDAVLSQLSSSTTDYFEKVSGDLEEIIKNYIESNIQSKKFGVLIGEAATTSDSEE